MFNLKLITPYFYFTILLIPVSRQIVKDRDSVIPPQFFKKYTLIKISSIPISLQFGKDRDSVIVPLKNFTKLIKII